MYLVVDEYHFLTPLPDRRQKRIRPGGLRFQGDPELATISNSRSRFLARV